MILKEKKLLKQNYFIIAMDKAKDLNLDFLSNFFKINLTSIFDFKTKREKHFLKFVKYKKFITNLNNDYFLK